MIKDMELANSHKTHLDLCVHLETKDQAKMNKDTKLEICRKTHLDMSVHLETKDQAERIKIQSWKFITKKFGFVRGYRNKGSG